MSAVLDEPIAAVAAQGPLVRFRAIADLALYAQNSRTHTPEQIRQLQTSLVEFGWTMPVLVDEQGVVAGHARIAAAQGLYDEIGLTLAFPDGSEIPFGSVPVLSCDGWSEDKRRAYVIVDNKLALNAGWDDAALSSEIQLLLSTDFDTGMLGFSDADMVFYSGSGADFKPGDAAGQSRLDQTAPVVCPSCGHEFKRA